MPCPFLFIFPFIIFIKSYFITKQHHHRLLLALDYSFRHSNSSLIEFQLHVAGNFLYFQGIFPGDDPGQDWWSFPRVDSSFLWFPMIWVISDHWSWSESSKWIDPDVLGFGKMYANQCETNKKQKLTEKK